MKSRAGVTSASKADEAADEEESVLESQPVQKYSCGVMCRTSRDGQRTIDILRAIKSKARWT